MRTAGGVVVEIEENGERCSGWLNRHNFDMLLQEGDGWLDCHTRGSHSLLAPLLFCYSFIFTYSSFNQSFLVLWILSWSISLSLSLTLLHLNCLNPLIPKPVYICLPASSSSSLTLLPPNHSHHSLMKSWGKQALVFDGQVLSADNSLWSTLSVAKLGRVEWQPAFSGCTFRLW